MRFFPRPAIVRVAVLALALATSATACGDDPRPTYSSRAAEQLRVDAARVRAAAEARDVQTARTALHRLTRHVAAAQARGELPSDKARQILRAADWVAQDIAALPTPTPAPPLPQGDDDRHGEEGDEHEKEDDERGKEDKGEKGKREEDRTGEEDKSGEEGKSGEEDKSGHG